MGVGPWWSTQGLLMTSPTYNQALLEMATQSLAELA
ncbi:MAG: DUF2913 family protein, partial [Aeromonas veronii]